MKRSSSIHKALAALVITNSLWLYPFSQALAQDADKDYMLYEMQEGDTLRGLAARFFGGEQFLQELIRYNAIVTPNRVQAGDMVAIPLGVRDRAIAGLSSADKSLAVALTAQADQFAADAYNHALNTLHKAREAREGGSYAQSVALADLAIARSQISVQEANRVAPVQEPATLVLAHGKIELSVDKGETWKTVQEGDSLPVPSQVRTFANSRAELELADKSSIQIMEESTFALQDFLLDRRDGVRRSRMKVVLGNILSRITPKEHQDSTFEIETESAAVAIRGTVLRVGADKNFATRLSVLEGDTQLVAEGAGADVPEGFGSKTEQGQSPGKLRELLPAPLPVSPVNAFATGSQQLTFSWEPVYHRELGTYHFELARDPNFIRVVQAAEVKNPSIQSPVLEKGTYYWRVSTLDKKGLEGVAFDANQLTVELRLAVDAVPGGMFWKDGEQLVLGKAGLIDFKGENTDSSVVNVEYRLGQGEFQKREQPVRFEKEGTHSIQARGISRTGVTGPEKTFTAFVDLTPPKVEVELIPQKGSGNRAVYQLLLESSDNIGVKKIEYSLNRGPYIEYVGPVPLDPLVGYDVAFRAQDHVGNISAPKDIHVMAGWPEPEKPNFDAISKP